MVIQTKTLALAIALVALAAGAYAQGSINFQNRSAIGKGKAIYGIDSLHPALPVQGDSADYAGRSKLTGSAYTAGLFVQKNDVWVQIATSEFRTSDEDAGLLQGVPVVKPDGIKAGELVNLVIRVWDSRATSWEDVTKLQNATLARGESLVIEGYEVGGDRDGTPVLQKALINSGLQSFGLSQLTGDTDLDGLSDDWEQGIGRFQIIKGPFTWAEAKLDAEQQGGHLATVINSQEWSDLKTVLGAQLNGMNLWLGGTDEGSEGTWRWITGEKWSFTHWRTVEPANDSLGNGTGLPENYLMIWGHETEAIDNHEAFWNDITATGSGLALDGYLLERGSWTDPSDPDTDHDGLLDGEETQFTTGMFLTDPNNPDTDRDGLKDGDEVKVFKTNPLKRDTDGDGLSDFDEIVRWGTDPVLNDSDGDGLKDGDELSIYHTDPLKSDTDGDGASDGYEVEYGSDPKRASSVPMVSMRIRKAIELRVQTEPGKWYELQILRDDGFWEGLERVVGDGGTSTRLNTSPTNSRIQWRVVIVPTLSLQGMAYINPGTFLMGSPGAEAERLDHSIDETQHRVTLTRGFWIGKREVSQDEYVSVLGSNPSYYRNGVEAIIGGNSGPVTNELRHPVEYVSWFDATNYCGKLTEKDRSLGSIPEGYAYRLPTEAEWEFACRAGGTNAFHFGGAIRHGMANFWTGAEYDSRTGSTEGADGWWPGRTVEVGSYSSNAFGLFDMHGNVCEWCADWGGAYPVDPVTDPTGASTGVGRVVRGGSWNDRGVWCRSAIRYRGGLPPDSRYALVGFRVVLAPTD